MCFSAEASFIASAVLGAVGVVSVKKTTRSSEVAFASIPFLFAFQQFSEGFLWLSLQRNEFAFLQSVSTFVFLIIAQIAWPIWVPFSIMLLEKKTKRKSTLRIILGLGTIISLYLTYCFLFYNVNAEIGDHHIKYNLAFPHTSRLLWLSALFYFIPTVVSTFVSTAKRMHLLGTIIMLSCILTRLFTIKYFISIWCFFAALISVIVLLIIIRLQKTAK